MKTKIELKIKTFEYILYKMKEWRTEFPYVLQHRFDSLPKPPTKKKNLALFFIMCLACKDNDRIVIFSLFDKFFASHDGIIERDLWDNYDSIVTSKKRPEQYEGVPYEIIDDTIAHLKDVRSSMIHRTERVFVDIVKRHTSWMVFMDDTQEKLIPTKILIREKSHYARGKETLIFA